MAVLTCGEGGSTGSEVIAQINENTAELEETNIVNVFEYEANEGVDDISEVYQTVALLSVTSMLAGIYLIGISHTHSFTEINKSVYYQWRINGGAWEEFLEEPRDITDRVAEAYLFPFTHPADGQFTLEIQFRKEDTAGTLNVAYVNLWADWKKPLPAP